VSGVELDSNLSHAPTLRAQLDVLLRLAEAVHHHRVDLLRAARAHAARRRNDRRTWIHYVDVIASTFADPEMIEYVEKGSDALQILKRVADSGVIRTAESEVPDAVERIRSTLEVNIQTGADPLTYLVRANERAHTAIFKWLDVHGVVSELPTQPARLRLTYAEGSDDSCAVSSTLLNEIVWTIGPTEVAFWCAMQAESILKHEYLSHFAPRHAGLSASVREGWLMDVLIDEMDTQNSAERIFDVGAFNYLRDHIADPLSYHAAPGARDLPYRIRRINSELYWDMTRAIVSLRPADIDRVDLVDDLLQALLALSRAELERAIDGVKWSGFNNLHGRVDTRTDT
jgi:hypothetical protein